MREIKFRWWDKPNQKLVYSDDIKFRNDISFSALFCHGDIEDSFAFIPMQFTGLKDKNGKEIYDGDIFESTNPKEILVRFVVQWGYRDNQYSWGFKSLCTDKSYEFYDVKDSMKIIGNIYENPELLNQ